MARDNTIDQLNRLIEINKDAEAGFRTAADTVKNSELETVFNGYARQHAKFAAELQAEVERLGGNVSDSGTLGGALHRGWMDLKAALSGDSAAAILTSCESGEQSAEAAYADAVDTNPSGQTHTLIEKHRQQVKEFRTRLARLVGETEDGVEFQKNE
ncbi:MAG: PA2169 family four-helix-bundle protein [Acidobacteriaceae bacterium]|nr:PA2169 family four-helix-bundle protein [Acidobacteriaceae bacterium]